MSSSDALAEAYRHCEAVTRAEAANFYYGIRLLPRERRRAICAVYAFARRVDDIGDGALAREEKLAGCSTPRRCAGVPSSARASRAGPAGPRDGRARRTPSAASRCRTARSAS